MTALLTRLLPFAGAAIAVLIFVIHITTSTNIAVGGSYLVAILVASRFGRTRSVVLTAFLCAGFLFLATYVGVENPISAAIRSGAIGIGTYLVLRAQSAEDAVRRSELEWRELYENSPIMYFTLGVEGTVLSVNASSATELGYQAVELVGLSFFELFEDADRERVRTRLDLCRERLDQMNA